MIIIKTIILELKMKMLMQTMRIWIKQNVNEMFSITCTIAFTLSNRIKLHVRFSKHRIYFF